MRRFWLKKNNQIWDLSADKFAQRASFLANPQGLGVKLKIDSFEVERATFVENVKLESAEISGKLYFEGYAQFSAFAEYIGYVETTEPMRLYYCTAETKPDYNGLDDIHKSSIEQNVPKNLTWNKMFLIMNDEVSLMIIDISGVPLTPGNFGRDCLGNGEHIDEGYECCCDECDYGQCCYEAFDELHCRDCPHADCPRFGEAQEIFN